MSYSDYDIITDFLYLGNMNSVNTQNVEFTLIVNCSKDLEESNNCKKFIRIPIDDDPDDANNLLSLINTTGVLDQIQSCIDKGENVLIHCRAGMQRSCALTACYLLKRYKMIPRVAIEFIKYRRPIAFLGTVNFQKAIDSFYKLLHPNITC
jgi:protein-tyrosine phosphatase